MAMHGQARISRSYGYRRFDTTPACRAREATSGQTDRIQFNQTDGMAAAAGSQPGRRAWRTVYRLGSVGLHRI